MNIGASLVRGKDTMRWAHEIINGLRLAEPNKRSHLSGACLHAAIEHGMAIIALIEMPLYGSGMALMRLQLEAYLRGTWLSLCATDKDVDKAGKDDFPKINTMIASLEKPGMLDGGVLSKIKNESWNPLNSLTHTGYQQIGSRLNQEGIGSYFTEDQIIRALKWAESWTVLSAVGMLGLAKEEARLHSCAERVQLIASGD